MNNSVIPRDIPPPPTQAIPPMMVPIFLGKDAVFWALIISSIPFALFETLLLYFWGLKEKKVVITVFIMNLISWFLFYYAFVRMSEYYYVLFLLLLVLFIALVSGVFMR